MQKVYTEWNVNKIPFTEHWICNEYKIVHVDKSSCLPHPHYTNLVCRVLSTKSLELIIAHLPHWQRLIKYLKNERKALDFVSIASILSQLLFYFGIAWNVRVIFFKEKILDEIQESLFAVRIPWIGEFPIPKHDFGQFDSILALQ